MRMKKVSKQGKVSYFPPEMIEIGFPASEILCESVNGTSLPDAGYDDTELTF